MGKTLSYSDCNPPCISGIIFEYADSIMVETALFESDCILFVTVATSDKKSVDSPIPDNKLSNDEDTLPIKLSSQASATCSFIPNVDDAEISNDSPFFFPLLSPFTDF